MPVGTETKPRRALTTRTCSCADPSGAHGRFRPALKTPGQLTIGTDKPAYPPYFEGNDPTNVRGVTEAYGKSTLLR